MYQSDAQFWGRTPWCYVHGRQCASPIACELKAQSERVTLSPFTRRALSRELPASDTTGLVRQGGVL